jgi:hypothetical protein
VLRRWARLGGYATPAVDVTWPADYGTSKDMRIEYAQNTLRVRGGGCDLKIDVPAER